MDHNEVENYNWDEGLGLIWPIVNNPNTEKAIAMLIYWRLDGPWLSESSVFNNEAYNMNKLLKERLINEFYSKGTLTYDPIVDNQLSKVQIKKLIKIGYPIELIEPNWIE